MSKYDIDSIKRRNKKLMKIAVSKLAPKFNACDDWNDFSFLKISHCVCVHCANGLRPAYHNVNETIFKNIVYSDCPVWGHSHDFYAHSISGGQ